VAAAAAAGKDTLGYKKVTEGYDLYKRKEDPIGGGPLLQT